MRIAYILDWQSGPESGVGRKVITQISAWREKGATVELLLMCPDSQKMDWSRTVTGCTIFPYRNFFERLISRRACTARALTIGADINYCRLGILSMSQLRMVGKGNTVIEINTKGSREYATRSLALQLIYLAGRFYTFRKCLGACAVSDEIASEFMQKSRRALAVRTFPNSIQLGSITPKSNSPSGEHRVVFVGSPGNAWHGLKRVQTIAKALPWADFYVVGPESDGEANPPQNLHYIGARYGNELTSLLSSMDIGISSMALDLIGISEASPLKTREYLAAGLPVMGMYKDTAFGEECEFFLQIKPFRDTISDNCRDEISNFLRSWKGKRVTQSELYAIDSDNIESGRLDFFDELLDASQ